MLIAALFLSPPLIYGTLDISDFLSKISFQVTFHVRGHTSNSIPLYLICIQSTSKLTVCKKRKYSIQTAIYFKTYYFVIYTLFCNIILIYLSFLFNNTDHIDLEL